VKIFPIDKKLLWVYIQNKDSKIYFLLFIMKILIMSTGPTLESDVSPVFGRAPYFLIFDLKKETFKSIPNIHIGERRGVGVAVSQEIVSEGVDGVISGNFGPSAFSFLRSSGIKLYRAVGLSAKDALEDYKNGKLKQVTVSDTASEFGFPGRGGRGRRGFGFGRRFGRRGGGR